MYIGDTCVEFFCLSKPSAGKHANADLWVRLIIPLRPICLEEFYMLGISDNNVFCYTLRA